MKNLIYYVFGGAFLLFGTFIYFVNSYDKKNMFENPEEGQYYVVQNYPVRGQELIYKIKAVRETDIVFYVPQMGFRFGFERNEHEDEVREADQSGEMYGTEMLAIGKNTLRRLYKNGSFSGEFNDKPRVKHIFK